MGSFPDGHVNQIQQIWEIFHLVGQVQTNEKHVVQTRLGWNYKNKRYYAYSQGSQKRRKEQREEVKSQPQEESTFKIKQEINSTESYIQGYQPQIHRS